MELETDGQPDWQVGQREATSHPQTTRVVVVSEPKGAEALEPTPQPQPSRTEIKRGPREAGKIKKYRAPSPPLRGVDLKQ